MGRVLKLQRLIAVCTAVKACLLVPENSISNYVIIIQVFDQGRDI
jgi:hypothetical protein